ncbi:heavy metal sensor histidine kinase [Stenotrophomonas sp. 24(2023)]|uniref:heavy metal sensor histidine kinase n=1 Tax=Stenotrophomonas sp. 24(2023) TaxID=3068324 RepID=UPI0027DF042D|nr:heavy metal sensor histidine kinase [Stenotrophomonas sp. 24(2023)]WMJ69361.1 heavy metal sensor histidine kinase [Stenotrophomonas sp. 24(2023)]
MSRRTRFTRLSTANRLTVLFAVVTIGVMAALGLAIRLSVRHNLIAQDYAELENKAALIADIARSAPSAGRAERLAVALGHHPDMAFAVRDDNGQLLFSTAPGELQAYARQQPADAHPVRRDWVLADGRRFHVLHLRQPLPEGGQLSVLLGIDDVRHAAFLHRFQQLLAACIMAAALASSLLGGYVVRRSLRPLRTLADEARQVTAERLDRRLSSEGAPVELEQLAHTLNGMLAGLQQDFDRLAAFSADLAHELRTPITNMLTQVHVVLAHPRSAEDYRDTLASCAEELQRLSQTVGDLLYLAQAEAHGALPSREPVAMAALADALLEFYGLLAEDRQLRLLREGEARLDGNRLMLHRALANLLSNALQHAAPGSTVRVVLQQQAGQCRISVHNTGTPIPAALQPRLFDRFYRAPRHREQPRHEGAGLGLAITRAIAQAHGGSVELVSDADGTVFTLVLPRAARS